VVNKEEAGGEEEAVGGVGGVRLAVEGVAGERHLVPRRRTRWMKMQ
jgi:hypothetical protein